LQLVVLSHSSPLCICESVSEVVIVRLRGHSLNLPAVCIDFPFKKTVLAVDSHC